jgi:hypothetical protein
MKNRTFAIAGVTAAALLGVPRNAAAAAPALNWKCGPNTRIEGNMLIADAAAVMDAIGGDAAKSAFLRVKVK